MRVTPTAPVNHTSRRIVSAVAGLAVALTMLRFGIEQHRTRRRDGAAR